MAACPDSPVPGVVALLHAHGDGVAAAVPVGALVGQQNIIAQLGAEGVAAQAVPHGIAPVAVEDDSQRGTVVVVVVSRGQRCAVLRGDMYRREGVPRQRIGVGAHGLAVDLPRGHIGGGGHGGGGLLVKGDAVDAVGCAEHGSTGCGGRSKQRMFFHAGHLTLAGICVYYSKCATKPQ